MRADLVLFGAGYPVAVAVIARFVPVVRDRRWRWLAAHHAAVAAIIAGWALRGEGPAVAVNSAWLVASSLWFLGGGAGGGDRRGASRTASTPQLWWWNRDRSGTAPATRSGGGRRAASPARRSSDGFCAGVRSSPFALRTPTMSGSSSA